MFTDIPNKLESAFIQRNASNTVYEQINASGSDLIFYHNSTGEFTADRISVWAAYYGIGTGGSVIPGWSYNISTSYASGSTTSSYALTASYVIGGGPGVVAGGSYPITTSFSSGSISASYASSASYSLTQSVNVQTTSSYADFAPVLFTGVRIINGDLIIRSPYTNAWYKLDVVDDGNGNFTTQLTEATATGSILSSGSISILSASYALTASYALNGEVSSGTPLVTGSTYPITASHAISASYATIAYVVSQSADSMMLWAPTQSIVKGAIGFTSPSSTDFVISQQSSSTGGISLMTSGSQRVYITNNGVTMGPLTSSTLQVVSDVYFGTNETYGANIHLQTGDSQTNTVTIKKTDGYGNSNVVISGSLKVRNGITGSLYGTSSYSLGTEYIQLIHPHIFSSAALPYTSSFTSPLYGHAIFNATADSSSNFVEYMLKVPYNLDKTKVIEGQLDFTIINNDTASYSHILSMASISNGGENIVIPTNEITFTSIVTGSANTIIMSDWTALTNWSSSVTPGHMWKIRLARNGLDSSVSQSADASLNIRYTKI